MVSMMFGNPKIIFTDGDRQMTQAIQSSFPSLTHLLCTFPLYNFFWKKLGLLLWVKKNTGMNSPTCGGNFAN